MARCKNCGRFSFFTKINPSGLCEECEKSIENIIMDSAHIMKNTLDNLEKETDPQKKLEYCNILYQNALKLEKYERKGIKTIKPYPSIFLKECSRLKKELSNKQRFII